MERTTVLTIPKLRLGRRCCQSGFLFRYSDKGVELIVVSGFGAWT